MMTKTTTMPGLTGNFSTRLVHARKNKGWSQSDLARAIWGTTTDKAGNTVAKNRDRISTYEMGKSRPTNDNLEKLADALGLTIEQLAPDLIADAAFSDASPEIDIRMVEGGVYLRVNMMTDMDTATKVAALLAQGRPGDEG